MNLSTCLPSSAQRFLLLVGMLLVTGFSAIKAQKISVTNFYLDENDLTAAKEAVEDQNGSKCALIRVQTTQKGFIFDVGSLGVTRIEDNHPGEIWLWVPFGVRHISIRHARLGSLPKYEFPIRIQKSRTYYMDLTSDQIFINNYDDTQKQRLKVQITPANAQFTLNGMRVPLDAKGQTEQELYLGVYTYKVEAENFYPKEGQVTIDDPDKPTQLVIDDLRPIMSKAVLHVSPAEARILLDGKPFQKANNVPFDIQTGKHTLAVSCDSYRPDTVEFVVQNEITANVDVHLSQLATYKITANTTVSVEIEGEKVGFTPIEKEMTSGTYRVKATRNGYKPFEDRLVFNSSKPEIQLHLKKIYNFENEIYVEAGGVAGSVVGGGASVGVFMNKIHFEAGWFKGFGKSETLYRNYPNMQPDQGDFQVNWWLTCKTGYGFPIATCFRLTPQVGAAWLKLSCSCPNMGDGANVW